MRWKLSKIWLWVLFLASGLPVLGAGITEYSVKGLFLYNFTKFVTWPEKSFSRAGAPLIIGVLGDDPFGETLNKTVDGKIVNGRPIQVRHFDGFDPRQAASIRKCHILFICSSENDDIGVILDAIKGSSVLTVSEYEGFPAKGGVILFFRKENRLALKINPEAAKKAGLQISSKLLQISEIYTVEDN